MLLAIHGVCPASQVAVERLRDNLCHHADAEKIALFVVPNRAGEGPVTRGSAFAKRLREWADDGAEIFVHGWSHRTDDWFRAGKGGRSSRATTRSEGEFLSASYADALRLMREGKALLEDIIGRGVTGFVAPAWLYGRGALDALATSDFALCEDYWKVWSPASGQILAENPVMAWPSRNPIEVAASLCAAKVLPLALRRTRVVRMGINPNDVRNPKIMASMDKFVARLAATHRVARYEDILRGDRQHAGLLAGAVPARDDHAACAIAPLETASTG